MSELEKITPEYVTPYHWFLERVNGWIKVFYKRGPVRKVVGLYPTRLKAIEAIDKESLKIEEQLS